MRKNKNFHFKDLILLTLGHSLAISKIGQLWKTFNNSLSRRRFWTSHCKFNLFHLIWLDLGSSMMLQWMKWGLSVFFHPLWKFNLNNRNSTSKPNSTTKWCFWKTKLQNRKTSLPRLKTACGRWLKVTTRNKKKLISKRRSSRRQTRKFVICKNNSKKWDQSSNSKVLLRKMKSSALILSSNLWTRWTWLKKLMKRVKKVQVKNKKMMMIKLELSLATQNHLSWDQALKPMTDQMFFKLIHLCLTLAPL